MRVALSNYQKSRRLTGEDNPFDLSQWKTCYAHTIGCVGLLKDWLTTALAEAVETGAKTISPSLLAAHAASIDRCHQMITDIEEGEKALRLDPEATEKLLARLGLSPRRTREKRTSQEAENAAPAAPSRRRRVGQRNPTRDAVKKEVETDG